MKKMICEICESQKIKKENGVFVCQDCGTEYSLEEAKKLLRETGNENYEVKTIYSEENTNVSNKDDLIYSLFLWAENLNKLNDLYLWFNLNLTCLQNEGFWNKDEYFQDDLENLFPYIAGFLYDPANYSDRIFDGVSLKTLFDSEIIKLNAYQKLLLQLEIYSKEKTNSSHNLYSATEPKYKIGYYTLFEVVNRLKSEPSTFINDLDKANITYTTYSKFWGTSKTYSADNVQLLVRNVGTKIKKSKEEFVKIINQQIDIYRVNCEKIKPVYVDILNNCKELEKILFIPYEYRNIDIVMNLINLVRAGKATTWKELINLYDTQEYRNKTLYSLNEINESLNNINQTLFHGFKMISTQLKGISNKIDSIDNNINTIKKDLATNLKSINRNSFITMWNTL